MSQNTVVLGLGAIALLVTVILFAGVFFGHKGLFEVGAELSKYVFSAIVGALVAASTGKKP